MQRDTTVRSRVIDYLVANGPIEDKSGRATSRLKEAVGYPGGDAGFIRIVGLMADAGEILREVRGKRTYRIAAPEGAVASSPAPAPESSSGDGELDYDELAASLLARVANVLSAPQPAGGDSAAWARRRIEQLESRVTALQRDLARAKAETDAVREERDALRSQLDAATHNIDVLTERIGSTQRPSGRAAARLDSEEQALLHRLGHRRPPREAV
ncbi:MAG TPA: hypothetical protein VE991_08525 [Acidimicrobiales bacterium]|nr:hypothetical protein [Acidimicrobiales bacterium]